MKSATHAYVQTRSVILPNGVEREVHTARLPDLSRGYHDLPCTDREQADRYVNEWNADNLKIRGVKC